MSPRSLLPAVAKRLAFLAPHESAFSLDAARFLSTESRDLLSGAERHAVPSDGARGTSASCGVTSASEAERQEEVVGGARRATVTSTGKGSGPSWLVNLNDAGVWEGFGVGEARGYHSSRCEVNLVNVMVFCFCFSGDVRSCLQIDVHLDPYQPLKRCGLCSRCSRRPTMSSCAVLSRWQFVVVTTC